MIAPSRGQLLFVLLNAFWVSHMSDETVSRNRMEKKDKPSSSNVVQLEFEPFEAPLDQSSSPPQMDEPPLEAYSADEELEKLPEYELADQPELGSETEAPATDMPKLNVPFVDGGRWQVVDTNPDGGHEVLLATDDPHEAQEARAGYATDPGHQVRVFDAETGALAIEEVVIGSEATLCLSEDFQSAMSSIELQSGKLQPDTDQDIHANEPIEDLGPDQPSNLTNEQEDKWVSSKVLQSDRQKALSSTNDDNDLEDDQIFGPDGTGPVVSGQGHAMGYGAQSNLGALTSAAFSGIRALFSRTKQDGAGGPAHDESMGQGYESGVGQSFEREFNAGDLSAWRSSSHAREMAVLNTDMTHSLDAVRRLTETPYVQLAKELDVAGQPLTDAQKTHLAQLKEQPEFLDAVSDIKAFIGDVHARAVKVADDIQGTAASQTQLEQSLVAWSKDMDEAIRDIPDANLQKDLMDKIKKIIDLIMESFSPSKSKGAAPSL